MPLIDLKTNLKSLKFGYDRPGRGSSNQPYITKEIPEEITSFSGNDILVRGGALLPFRIADDVSRLTKMFTDTKNFAGLMYPIKQNLLINLPNNQKIRKYNQTIRLEQQKGIYLPTDTLLNAGGIALGLHFKSPGPDFDFNGEYYNNQYYDVVKTRNFTPLFNNRLVNIYSDNIESNKKSYDYSSLFDLSPISFVSVYPEDITKNKFSYQSNWGKGIPTEGTKGKPKLNYSLKIGASSKYFSITNIDLNDGLFSEDGGLLKIRKIYDNDSFDPTERINDNNSLTYYPSDVNSSISYKDNPVITDFRAVLRNNQNIVNKEIYEKNGILTAAPSYVNKNRNVRLHYNNPADKDRNLSNYTNGTGKGAVDLINASEIGSDFLNDLVKFRIKSIDSDNPATTINLQFRALIKGFGDGYDAEWNSIKYVGRGENFYKYMGFNRKISLSWYVVANSKEELIPMYKKLNYLASNLMPDYSEEGFMRGPLINLTIGGYLVNMPGYISSLRYSIPEQATWEIGIDTEGNFDNTVKELPHIIEVSSFEFTPIHDFLPRKVQNPLNQETKFIALSTVGHKASDLSNYTNE